MPLHPFVLDAPGCPLVPIYGWQFPQRYLFDLDQLGSSAALLLTFLALGLLVTLLYLSRVLGWVLGIVQVLIQGGIRAGFRLWAGLLSWAHWPTFLGLVIVMLLLGLIGRHTFHPLALLFGVTLLFSGIVTCLAYMFIDLERYEVARGYKALHNPLKGQQLATNLVHYGHQVGVPLLVVATVGVVVGFALTNQGLYESIGQRWYHLSEGEGAPDFVDFLAYTLLNLFRVVDLLHLASTYNYVHATYVQQAGWQAATLLALFRTFFTLVLLQQIFASVRRGRLLAETISDFWSPHPPIHERARVALPQHGAGAVRPLLASLRTVEVLTAEQRTHIPRILADIGPVAIPILSAHLHDEHEHVRGMAVAALGRLHALDAVPLLVELRHDPSDWVRQCLAEALGAIGAASAPSRRRRRGLRRGSGRRAWLLRRKRQQVPPTPPVSSTELVITSLRGALSDSSTLVRIQAIQSLGQLGPAAAAVAVDLYPLLGDASEAVRCQAAESLGPLGSRGGETVAALVPLLEDPSPAIRTAAAHALGTLKKVAAAAVPALLPLLHEAEETVRQAAAEAINQIGTMQEEAVQVLGEGLASADNIVRAQTAETLGDIGEAAAEAAPLLAEALQDDNDRVRAKAAQALGKMGEGAAEAVPSLVRALRDQDHWVSALAAEALGEIGDSAAHAVPALVRSLRHPNPRVRSNAAEALGKIGPAAASALPALEQASGAAEDEVRRHVLFALGEIGGLGPGARQVLLAALEDANPQIRAVAVAALGKRAELHAEAFAPLLHAIEDASDEVKLEVARALPQLAGPRTPLAEALCRLLEDSSAIQVQAAQSLGKLGPDAALAGAALLRLTQAGEAEVREQAVRALAQIQAPEAEAAFLIGLKDAQPDIRKLASAGLIVAAAVPADAVPSLVEALRDPETQVRANAARALARLPELPGDAVAGLVESVADADDGVRLNAALALRQTPPGLLRRPDSAGLGNVVVQTLRGSAPGQVRQAFVHLLTDLNPRLRLLAAGTLLDADAEDAEATTALIAALADPAPRVRRSALEWVEAHHPTGDALHAALRERAEQEAEPELIDLVVQILERMEKERAAEQAGQTEPQTATGVLTDLVKRVTDLLP